jgi:hypothetical protein
MTLDPAQWLVPGEPITFLRVGHVHPEFLDGRFVFLSEGVAHNPETWPSCTPMTALDSETGDPHPVFRSFDGHEEMCPASEEGVTWIRGCGEEARAALLASRALLHRTRRVRFSNGQTAEVLSAKDQPGGMFTIMLKEPLTLTADCTLMAVEEDS